MYYYENPYLKELSANVIESNGNKIILDKTIFFPGGGGQEKDTGTINNIKVLDIIKENNKIIHILEKPVIEKKVLLKLDWDKRYSLMKGHSAEHLFVGRLMKYSKEINIKKISITENKFSLFIDGNLTWDLIQKAQKETNEKIRNNDSIKIEIIQKEEITKFPNLRIKLDKINDSSIRIAKIGDYDFSACSGIHINKTGELDYFLVNKFSKAKDSDFEIEFLVGEKAKEKALELSKISLSISDILGTTPEKLENTIKNQKSEIDSLQKSNSFLSKSILNSIQSKKIHNFLAYINSFEGVSKKELIEKAGELIKQDNLLVLFTNKENENSFIILACNENLSLDCNSILSSSLKKYQAKGGGKKNFTMGSFDSKYLNPLIEDILKELK